MRCNLVLLALAIVCVGAEKGFVSPPEPKGPTDVEMVATMEQHYFAAIHAHDALIQGDLDSFRARLAELVGYKLPPNAPDLWMAFDAPLRTAARQGSESTDLAKAANTMASVALACGACHQAVVDGPVYPVPPLEKQGMPLKAKMSEHQWSTLMLWNGVTGPSEYAWNLGTKGLVETWIFPKDKSPVPTKSLLDHESALRALGEEARTATSPDTRALLYGRILATCGGCHQAGGVKLPSQKPPSP